MLNKLRILLAAGAMVLAGAASASAATVWVPYQVAQAPARFAGPRDMQGVVTYFNRFNMTVRVDGVGEPVILHPGTIIHPTGANLHPGMIVNVGGHWAGGNFYANRINVVRW
jgi:hypothetical protein